MDTESFSTCVCFSISYKKMLNIFDTCNEALHISVGPFDTHFGEIKNSACFQSITFAVCKSN